MGREARRLWTAQRWLALAIGTAAFSVAGVIVITELATGEIRIRRLMAEMVEEPGRICELLSAEDGGRERALAAIERRALVPAGREALMAVLLERIQVEVEESTVDYGFGAGAAGGFLRSPPRVLDDLDRVAAAMLFFDRPAGQAAADGVPSSSGRAPVELDTQGDTSPARRH